MLLEHRQACRHMTCGRNGHAGAWIADKGCKHQFCFICLGAWAGHRSSDCFVHPPQLITDLPKLSTTDFRAKKNERLPDFGIAMC